MQQAVCKFLLLNTHWCYIQVYYAVQALQGCERADCFWGYFVCELGMRGSTVSNSSLVFNHIASWIYETDQMQTAINLMVVSLTDVVRRFRSSPSHDRTRNQIKNYVVPNWVGTMHTVNRVGNKLSTKGMIVIVVPGSVEPNTSLVWPGYLVTHVSEDGVGLCTIGNHNSLEGICLQGREGSLIICMPFGGKVKLSVPEGLV